MLFLVNLPALLTINVRLAVFSVIVIPVVLIISFFFFRLRALRVVPGAGGETLQHAPGKPERRAWSRPLPARSSRKASSRRVNWEKYVRGKRLLIAHALLAHHRHHVRPADDCGLRSGPIMAINGTITLGQSWPIRAWSSGSSGPSATWAA
ncbi:MAG: hypothetical protein R2838_12570 [Caldilineaceae bacterium]